MPIHSHIQIPKFLLKLFQHSDIDYDCKNRIQRVNCVYVLDTDNLSISYCKIKSFNVKADYYSVQTELSLSSKIERPFSEIMSRSKDRLLKTASFDSNKSDGIIIDEDEHKTICSFIACSFLRAEEFQTRLDSALSKSKFFRKGLDKESIFGSFTPDRTNYRCKIIKLIENRTNIEFIIGRCCFTVLESAANTITLFLPYGPNYGYWFEMTKNDNENFSQIPIIANAIIESTLIDSINLKTVVTESCNNGQVIAKGKNTLERICSQPKNNTMN